MRNNPALLKLPMNPCAVCQGVMYYPVTRNCVKCMQKHVRENVMAKAAARKEMQEALKMTKPTRTFTVEEIANKDKYPKFIEAEDAIFGGVWYEDVERAWI